MLWGVRDFTRRLVSASRGVEWMETMCTYLSQRLSPKARGVWEGRSKILCAGRYRHMWRSWAVREECACWPVVLVFLFWYYHRHFLWFCHCYGAVCCKNAVIHSHTKSQTSSFRFILRFFCLGGTYS
jgi:hypothetical protein